MKKLFLILCLSGCASVTPQDRAKAYEFIAKDAEVKCQIYHFDLSSNLTLEVPAMTKLCANVAP